MLYEFHLMRNVFRLWRRFEKESSKEWQEKILKNIIRNCRTFFSQRKFGEKYTTTNDVERLQRFQRSRTDRVIHFGSETTGNNFLDAYKFYLNFRKFSFGKRAGKSPVEHGGLDTRGKDWLEYLGFPRLKLSTEIIYEREEI